MIFVACLVYIRHRRFGLGGFILLFLGFIMVGLPLWKTANVSGIEARLVRVEKRIQNIEKQLTTIARSKSSIKNKERKSQP